MFYLFYITQQKRGLFHLPTGHSATPDGRHQGDPKSTTFVVAIVPPGNLTFSPQKNAGF